MNIPFTLGRTILGGFFLYSGVKHLMPTAQAGLAQYAAAKGVPFPQASVAASGVAMALGGAAVLLGVKPQLGALTLAGVLASVTPTMHDFWNAPEAQQQNELIHFSKNVALLGATLALAGIEEPWPASLSR